MLTNPQIAVAVAVVAVITFSCRIAPFVLLRGRKDSALLGLVSAWLSVVTYVALIVFYMAGHRPRRVRPAGD